MARNNLELSRGGKSSASSKFHSTSPKYFKSIKGENSPPQRLSPSRTVTTPPGPSSPRTSPGLIAGHYAGCKFSEPPLPSALPQPPQHWMQQQPVCILRSFIPKQEPEQLAQQLKVLLKVQA